MDPHDPTVATNVAAGVGFVLIVAGLLWARAALGELDENPSISFSRHWGGLGSGQSGWEISGNTLSMLLRLLLSIALIAVGTGLLWPRGDAGGNNAPATGNSTPAATTGGT